MEILNAIPIGVNSIVNNNRVSDNTQPIIAYAYLILAIVTVLMITYVAYDFFIKNK